jgi:UrcA family protein
MSLVAACALAAALTPAAYAETITTEVRVTYGDLNLDNAEDASVLLGRLERAARRACGGHASFDPNYDMAPRATEERYRSCYKSALERAVAQFDAPNLARAYARSHTARAAVIASR